jgi:RNA polymerase sigma-70 factor (ECF subfamily)
MDASGQLGLGNFSPPPNVQNNENALNDDSRLIEQALAGQVDAFEQLVHKYQDRLFRTMVHLVGHREDARDVVQEALVQAFVKLETFRGGSAFYTWLYRIAFNLAASHGRRRRPTASVEQARERHGLEPADGNPGPEACMEQRQQCEQVRRAIGRLEEQYRAVIVLRELEGCTYEQIAEVLEVPVGTVRSRLHRGRMQLKEELIDRSVTP